MKKIFLSLALVSCFMQLSLAQKYSFRFDGKVKGKSINVSEKDIYGANDSSYGYDFNMISGGDNPYFFSVDVPEGNYRVTLTLGNKYAETNTTIKAESRRLMLENVNTPKGKLVKRSFVVNVRNKMIGDNDSVRIKPREVGKLNWDNKLTLEINGSKPGLVAMTIERVDVPTIFLAGNSTVVDQDSEPWCGWGQILPRFMNSKIAVANYAESGEAANSFVSAKRFAKILTKMKKGDYIFIEFGHNDQKQKGEGKGPYLSYKKDLEYLINESRKKGGIPILVTPMHRRSFDESGEIINTHGEYPDAVRLTSREHNVMLIDLNEMSKTLYEAWGVEESKKAFVHYPLGTFPGQDRVLADNTHFNTYGGYQICKSILKGLMDNNSSLTKFFVKDFKTFDPAYPDKIEDFNIPPTPFSSIVKPDGN